MKNITTGLFLFLLASALNAQVLFEDDFSKPKLFGESSLAYYQNGSFHIFADKGRMVYDDDHEIKDFVAEVRTEFIDGADNQGYGMFFRAADFNNCYVFTISANGYFELGGYKKGKWFIINKWERSDAIRKNGINYLRVECKGSRIGLFINGQSVKSIQDFSFSTGFIGIVAYNKVHMHFDDLKVFAAGTKVKSDYNFEPEAMDVAMDYSADPEAVFIDNFNDRSKNWSDAETVHYERGYYAIYDGDKGHFAWQGINIPNYRYEANLKVEQWQKNGSVGITTRMDGVDNYYGLFITEDKNYYFEKNAGGVVKSLILRTPIEFDINAAQTLAIEMHDDAIWLFLNGSKLTEVEDPEQMQLSNEKFGLYASKGVRANFLSLKLSPIPFSWSSAAWELLSSWCTWASLLVIGLSVLSIYRTRTRKAAELMKKRKSEIIDMIRHGQGTLSLGDVMFKYKINKKHAQSMLEHIVQEYGGAPDLNPDGSLVYEFPDFMPSEDKLRRDLIAFASKKNGRITVTETAHEMKMDLTEAEMLLDSMIDGKRVRKSESGGVVYYEFVEIIAGLKNR